MLSPGAAIIWVLRPDIQVACSHSWWLQAQLVLPLRVLQLSKLGLLHAPWVLTAWKLGSKQKVPKHVEAEAAGLYWSHLEQYTASLLPHSTGQRDSQGQPWFKEKGNRLHILTEGKLEFRAYLFFFNFNALDIDFPGGIVVKNLAANTGEMSLIPGLGRFHMLRSNYAPVPQLLKPTHPRARAPNLRVAPTHCSQRKPTQSNKDPVQQKLVNK